uniref:aldehyde dehydrogenase family protein n=1 Tax=Serratia bockelmannii TaxID=2703793 RepID=UPI003CFBBC43
PSCAYQWMNWSLEPKVQGDVAAWFGSVPAHLQYGSTWINTHFTLASEMPHGGLKRSGYGKDLSSDSLQDYSVVRHVMAKFKASF